MTNPYQAMVKDYARLLREGRALPLGGLPEAPRPVVAPDAPRALVFAPHPDDECIVGALPLRLLRERGMNVIDVAVTQGSNPSRQAGRLEELTAACRFLGFGLRTTVPGGLMKINRKGRVEDPANWSAAVRVVADLLARETPAVVFLPHAGDWNSTHIGTHDLVVEAMTRLGPDFTTTTIETEFWAAMDTPNLVVESSEADVADLVAAISFHVGEVKRNPYHLTLPAWMQDNVRRGGELVGGQGGAVPDFAFATLYRVRRWSRGAFASVFDPGRVVGAGAPLDFV